MQIDMRFRLVLLIVVAAGFVSAGIVKRSSDAFINSMNYGGTVTFGEQGVADCLALGNPYWKCYTEQSGINPEWR
uniref:SFRICE_001593 n=1 Tax=Spodoptera frugiperda TaxID=7108 RepID=A0A2H1VQR7_SPOFR